MIICGYQGVGKSTYCRNHKDTAIDLDSSNYTKTENWEIEYIKDAMRYKDKKVFISAHKNVINVLLTLGIGFELLIPSLNKETWRSRLEFRYNKNPILPNLKAIRDFEKNFEKDMSFYAEVEKLGIKTHRVNARIITTIEEVFE